MKANRRRESRFERYTRRLLVLCCCVFVVGVVTLNSYEASLNIQCENLEKEIATIESDIDGLDMQKQDLASFSRIEAVAQAKGYTYKQNTMTAAVVGVQRD